MCLGHQIYWDGTVRNRLWTSGLRHFSFDQCTFPLFVNIFFPFLIFIKNI